jgi:predicted negative regulator of RcsB-dependent stress response
MDLAKIYIQNLQFKIAKHRLDEVISHDSQDMEAYLLKARIAIVLKQKKEFETMLDLLYHKIVEEGGLVKFTGNYNDVLKYLYKPVNDLIDQQLQQ